jgi:hypothetical protein
MKRILILTALALLTGACSVLQPSTLPAPVVDEQATIDSTVRTAQAQTMAALPSPTVVPPTETGSPTVVAVDSPTLVVTDTPSASPAPNLTTTPVTATVGTINPTPISATATQPVSSGGATLTPTLGILLYGTLPPAVPSADITIFNKSKAQAYISLQNDAVDRSDAVLEYPVKKEVHVKAPLGYYLYVVWVGGRQIVGEFVLHSDDDLTITIYKDKVVVE